MPTPNIINWTDLMMVWEYARSPLMWRRIGRRLSGRFGKPKGDIFAQSKTADSSQIREWLWWLVPQVRRRAYEEVTGSPDIPFKKYFAEKYLKERVPRAASLLCGAGHCEREWLEYVQFDSFEGYDISEASLNQARTVAEREGFACLKYSQANINKIELQAESYDVIFVEYGLHHLAQLDHVLLKIKRALKPTGLLVTVEYIGNNFFQWDRQHSEYADAMLHLIPKKWRRWAFNSNRTKSHCIRPGRLRMYIEDPSESLRPQEIVPLIRSNFRVLEERPFSGGLMQRVLDGIAWNFIDASPESDSMIDCLFEIERTLTSGGHVEPHFIWMIAAPE